MILIVNDDQNTLDTFLSFLNDYLKECAIGTTKVDAALKILKENDVEVAFVDVFYDTEGCKKLIDECNKLKTYIVMPENKHSASDFKVDLLIKKPYNLEDIEHTTKVGKEIRNGRYKKA